MPTIIGKHISKKLPLSFPVIIPSIIVVPTVDSKPMKSDKIIFVIQVAIWITDDFLFSILTHRVKKFI